MRFVLPAIFVAVAQNVFAMPADTLAGCHYILQGKVVDSETQSPLPFTAIYIPAIRRGATTDDEGAYQIRDLCPGAYLVKCSHVGCPTLADSVSLREPVTTLNFEVPHTLLHVYEEVVITAHTEEEPVGQPTVALSGQELAQARGKTLGEALKVLPGVNSLQTGGNISKPIIHGLHGNRVLILNNGIRQEGQQWGSEHAPEIDPFIASRITVIKGPGALRYGADALGGVILVEAPYLPARRGVLGEMNLAGQSNGRQGTASGMLEGAIAKIPGLSWRMQGTLQAGGNLRSPAYFQKNTGNRQRDFSLAAGYHKAKYGAEVFYSQFNTEIAILSASHIGNVTDLQRAINSPVPLETSGFSYKIGRPYQQVGHELLKAQAHSLLGKSRNRIEIIYARQYNERNEYDKHPPLNDSLAALNLPELHYEITTHNVNADFKHYTGPFTGQLGASYMSQANTYAGRFFIPNFKQRGVGLYWTEALRLGSLQLEGGLRYDYRHLASYYYIGRALQSPQKEYTGYAYNLGAACRLSNSINIKANAGFTWRPPAINELYSNGLHHGAAAVEIGDSAMRRERANTTSMGMVWKAGKIKAELDVYHNMIRDFIYLSPQLPPTLTIRGAFPTFVYRQADARLYGLDAEIQYEGLYKGLGLGLKASLLRARNLEADNWLILMPADRYQGNVTYTFKQGKKLKDAFITANIIHVLRQSRAPAGQDYAAPPTGYTLPGLEAGTGIMWHKQRLNISLGVSNLLNTRYRDYLDRFRYYTDAMGRNISLRINVPLDLTRKKYKNDTYIEEAN